MTTHHTESPRQQVNVHAPAALADAMTRCAAYHGRSRHAELLLVMALHHSETLRRTLSEPDAVSQFESAADHRRALEEIERTLAIQRAELYEAEPPEPLLAHLTNGAKDN